MGRQRPFCARGQLTGEDVTGGSGLVAFEPLSGEALVVAGVIINGASVFQVSSEAAGCGAMQVFGVHGWEEHTCSPR